MPSLQHRVIDRALRLTRFRHWYWNQFDGVKMPKQPEPKNAVRAEFDGFPYFRFDPKGKPRGGIVVALHGGGYVAPASTAHLKSYRYLANATGRIVYAPYYPLAPFRDAETIRDWTLRVIALIADQHRGDPILLMGDSAGANLALQVVASGVEVERLLLWSPWLDVGGSNPDMHAMDGSCALLRADGMREFAQNYYGDTDPCDPMISPMFREAEALPPTLILSGDRDILHQDIAGYAARRIAEGNPVELHTEPGVWHDYMLMPTPEARRALSRSAAFLAASSATPANP